MLINLISELYDSFRLMHYRRLFGRIHEREGSLSATEAYSVDIIHLLGTPTIKQFSEFIGISQPNATYKINNLIAKGYIAKIPSDSDRREYCLHAADKFYKYYVPESRFITDAVRKLDELFSPEELTTFERILTALHASVALPERI